MPMNHDQGRPSKRWYKLCFIPTIGDSSDDSDTESVVIARRTPTQTSLWEQPSPPPSPPNLESDINWPSPLLPPPPLPSLPPSPPPTLPSFSPLVLQRRSSLSPPSPNLEPQINWDSDYFPPPSPPQTSLRPSSPLVPLQFQAANQEPQINLRSSPPPPPNPELRINWQYPPPPPFFPLPNLEPQLNWYSSPPSPTVTTQDRPNNDKSEFLRIPDSVMNAIHMVRISELNLTDELSQCPICMEEFKLGDEACQLPCNHTYKFECLLRWLNNSETCPVCRLQLNGFEGQGSSNNIGDDDDDSLDLEPQIPSQVINSLEDHSQLTEDSAGDNSDEADYDSACDDLNDIWFGNYQSSQSLQI
ncbi:hypothetical protein TSUD_417130 [Trifolium subterraneum]|uniref:RING-type E3 ubiquitin transferase n=1 Tax=Trifolium subterraneum TaxID=3900 RepID=A0A2Z6PJT6_TRISU|nr:hypothetical protein TSUD_417130 [Trifolium subterraneum]